MSQRRLTPCRNANDAPLGHMIVGTTACRADRTSRGGRSDGQRVKRVRLAVGSPRRRAHGRSLAGCAVRERRGRRHGARASARRRPGQSSSAAAVPRRRRPGRRRSPPAPATSPPAPRRHGADDHRCPPSPAGPGPRWPAPLTPAKPGVRAARRWRPSRTGCCSSASGSTPPTARTRPSPRRPSWRTRRTRASKRTGVADQATVARS